MVWHLVEWGQKKAASLKVQFVFRREEMINFFLLCFSHLFPGNTHAIRGYMDVNRIQQLKQKSPLYGNLSSSI